MNCTRWLSPLVAVALSAPLAHAVDVATTDASTRHSSALDATPPATDASAAEFTVRAGATHTHPAQCDGDRAGRPTVHVQPELVLSCAAGSIRECDGVVEARIDHCATGVLRLVHVGILSSAVSSFGASELIVLPGESRSLSIPFHTTRPTSGIPVMISLRNADGALIHSQHSVLVRNPAREQAIVACRACSGTWGPQGRLAHESCNCRSRNAGRRCTDGAQCDGVCVQTGVERVTPPRGCAPGRTCRLNPPYYRAVGRCSPFVHAFGCNQRIPVGGHAAPTRDALPIETSCVD
jgi:hypothetical protein